MKNIIMDILEIIKTVTWTVIGILLIHCIFKCYGAELPQPQPVLIGDLEPKSNERYIPQSGERVMIGDYEYVVVASKDWTQITNAVKRLEAVAERRWTKEHKTVEGRREWHGNHTNRVVSADGKTVTWFYPDGYEYVEQAIPMPPRTRPPKATGKPVRTRPFPARRVDSHLPDRLKAKREAIAKQPPAREVTVTFGPGGKVIEGAK